MFELIIFITGLFIGSFLGVLVDRIPKKQNAIKGRSRCDKCKKELGILDLIPILSFVFLRGKCRYCHAKLSLSYPAIEICTGIMFVLTFYFVSSGFTIYDLRFMISFVFYLFMIASFIVIFFTDLKYGIIPDKIVVPSILITFLWLIANRQSPIANHLLSGVGAFLFFIVISYGFYILTKKQSMGGGDIKLSFLLGLFLGFPGILVALYLAFLTGGIIAIILIIWKKKAFLKDTLPFGPFLITGAIISLFFGNYIYFLALNILGI